MRKNILLRSGAAALALSLSVSFFSDICVHAAEGNGSAGSPYIIKSPADLLEFAAIVNAGDYDAHGSLTSDLTITEAWTPIGGTDAASAFTGVFTGNGHTVTFEAVNEETYQGLFSYNGGTIQNTHVTGEIRGTDFAGGIAAVNQGTISGCSNQAAITASSSVSFAGGIAGVNTGTIQDSQNTGVISSPSSGANVGGIAGAAREGTLQNCQNSGAVSLHPADSDPAYAEGCAGGITGLNYKASIVKSGNYGSVSGMDANGYTGGIAGLNNGSIASCVNGAAIQGTYYAGGIAGYNFYNTDAGDASIHNTLNHGTVTANETGYGSVCGVNQQGVIYDTYYLEGTAAAGIGTSDNNGTTVKTSAALASGEVTFQLNGSQSSDPVWYQTLESDPAPVLDAEHKIVYMQNKDGAISYTNEAGSHTDHAFGEDGSCDICGYQSVSLYGHSLTLDGALGLNYYYYIDPMYYQNDGYTITASFVINGKTKKDTFDVSSVLATGDSQRPQVYGFQLYIDSDEMTSKIQAELEIKKADKTIVTLSDDGTFCGYDYLKELYQNQDGTYSPELQDLAQAISTYDYYARKHFQYYPSYEPEIQPLLLESVTSETLQMYRQTVENQENYEAKHVAVSLNFRSENSLILYMSSPETLELSTLFMGYKTHGSADDYTYVPAEKSGAYYRAFTEKVPASDLDIMWDCAFFQKQDDGSYKQITAVKTAGPLSYVESTLRTNSKESMRNLAQALYLYHEATKTYFTSVSQE